MKHLFLIIFIVVNLITLSSAHNVEGKINIAQVPNTNQVSVNVVVTARTEGNKHISMVSGYTLECPVSPIENYEHLLSSEGTASDGNVLYVSYLPLGHETDGNGSYVAGYPMTRAWKKVLETNEEMVCKIQLRSHALFSNDQINFGYSGGGFNFNVTPTGSVINKKEILSHNVTLKPQQTTGSTNPCIAYCTEFDPLLIDLGQDGIHLGPSGRGVWFDMLNIGTPQFMQWVAPNGNEAFLVYDLNGNGIVDNGGELFGNGTYLQIAGGQQSTQFADNGFVALGQFDKPQLGGNDDGVISYQDEIWAKLSLWLDSNADGICTPDEMIELTESSIASLDIIPKQNQRQDPAGNSLPLWAWAKTNSQGNNKMKMVDVFFKGL